MSMITEEIKAGIDIVEIIGKDVQLKRRGSNYVGLCPFHQEKTPSFTVFPETNSFFCFGCGIGGDIYTYTMEYQGVDFPTAKKILADVAGIRIPPGPQTAKQRNMVKAAQQKRERVLLLAERIQQIIDEETERFIAAERLAHRIIREIKGPEDLEHSSIVWALRAISYLAYRVDSLLLGDAAEKLATALAVRGEDIWR